MIFRSRFYEQPCEENLKPPTPTESNRLEARMRRTRHASKPQGQLDRVRQISSTARSSLFFSRVCEIFCRTGIIFEPNSIWWFKSFRCSSCEEAHRSRALLWAFPVRGEPRVHARLRGKGWPVAGGQPLCRRLGAWLARDGAGAAPFRRRLGGFPARRLQESPRMAAGRAQGLRGGHETAAGEPSEAGLGGGSPAGPRSFSGKGPAGPRLIGRRRVRPRWRGRARPLLAGGRRAGCRGWRRGSGSAGRRPWWR